MENHSPAPPGGQTDLTVFVQGLLSQVCQILTLDATTSSPREKEDLERSLDVHTTSHPPTDAGTVSSNE